MLKSKTMTEKSSITPKRKSGQKVTLTEIAKACEVTTMTVSRALRQDPGGLDSTRRRILEVADRMGYQPNGKVGRPRRSKDKPRVTVDVILGMSIAPWNLFYSQLLVSIEQELTRRGCDCVIRTCDGDYRQFLHLCETLRESTAAATLIVGYFPLEQLEAMFRFLPRAILVDHTGDPRLAFPYEFVAFDNVEAARLAVRHLVDLGRQRILLVTGVEYHGFSRDVEQGYREILQSRGIEVSPELIQRTDFSASGAHAVLCQIMDKKIPFDAVFSNDEMAIGILRALHDKGRRVPDDVAVAGCDGLPVGLQTIPSLTTVILDHNQLGQAAVEKILAEHKENASPCRLRLVPKLAVRESTTVSLPASAKPLP